MGEGNGLSVDIGKVRGLVAFLDFYLVTLTKMDAVVVAEGGHISEVVGDFIGNVFKGEIGEAVRDI